MDFKPECLISLSEPSADSARGALRVAIGVRSDDVRIRGALTQAFWGPGDSLSVRVQRQSDVELHVFLDSSSQGTSVSLGDVLCERALSDAEATQIERSLQDAFFDALKVTVFGVERAEKQAVPADSLVRGQPAEVDGETPPARARVPFFKSHRIALGAVALVGVGLIGYGFLHHQKSQQDISQADFQDIQAQIRSQVDSKQSPGGLQGQNVAIQAMREMGLNPGKANTGCLVGVK